jgi:hypothetical protein
MSNLGTKVFWIAFPLAVTAVSILGVSRLRRGPVPVPVAKENAVTPAGPMGATAVAANPDAVAPAETAAPASARIIIPASTEIEVRLERPIATNGVSSGDHFSATVTVPVVVNGQTVIPAGAPVQGRVVSARKAGRFRGVAELSLALKSVQVNGSHYNVNSSTFTRVGHNHKKHDVEYIGGGTAAGALVGGLAGGGKGALIGAPVGAGAGAAGEVFTTNRDLVIPAETAMTFRLLKPVEVHL